MKISEKIKELLTLAGSRAYSFEELESGNKAVSVNIFYYEDYFQVAVDKWDMATDAPKHEGALIVPYDTGSEGYTLLDSLGEAMMIAAGQEPIASYGIVEKNGRKFRLVPID